MAMVAVGCDDIGSGVRLGGDVEVLAAVDGEMARMMMTATTDGRIGFRWWPEVGRRERGYFENQYPQNKVQQIGEAHGRVYAIDGGIWAMMVSVGEWWWWLLVAMMLVVVCGWEVVRGMVEMVTAVRWWRLWSGSEDDVMVVVWRCGGVGGCRRGDGEDDDDKNG
nr:hypothetical protein [Tanacetum cinerariifolium]